MSLRDSAIQANFCHIKPFKMRDAVDLTFTIDKVYLPKVLEILGNPVLGEDIWCAIARITPEAVKKFPFEHEVPDATA